MVFKENLSMRSFRMVNHASVGHSNSKNSKTLNNRGRQQPETAETRRDAWIKVETERRSSET